MGVKGTGRWGVSVSTDSAEMTENDVRLSVYNDTPRVLPQEKNVKNNNSDDVNSVISGKKKSENENLPQTFKKTPSPLNMMTTDSRTLLDKMEIDAENSGFSVFSGVAINSNLESDLAHSLLALKYEEKEEEIPHPQV